jgi:hypothetical protein
LNPEERVPGKIEAEAMEKTSSSSVKTDAAEPHRLSEAGAQSDLTAEETRSLRKKLENMDSMAQMGFDAATLVHDLSNIIGGMMGHVQLAQMTDDQEDWKRCFNIVGSGMNRARELITGFKTAVTRTRSFQLFNLRIEIDKAVEVMAPDLWREGIGWKVLAVDHFILSDPRVLRKALLICLTGVAINLPKGAEIGISATEMSGELVIAIAGYPSDGAGQTLSPRHPTASVKPMALRDEDIQYLETIVQEIGGEVTGNWDEPARLNCRIILPVF